MPSPASERTPLLRSTPQRRQNGSVIAGDEVTAAEVAQQGEGAAPQFPGLGSRASDSRDESIASRSHSATRQETEDLVKFEENGKLQGVGVWRFRCVFGGILLGYFVRTSDDPLQALFYCRFANCTLLHRLPCLTLHSWPQVTQSSHPTFMHQTLHPGCRLPFCLHLPRFSL
jgi:hypothetical protein